MIIVADSHIPYVQHYFSAYGDLRLIAGRAISRADVQAADMLLVRSITQVDEKLLADTPVKFVGSVTAGADHLATEWLDQAGIAWSIARGFNAPPVADYVVSVIAALQKMHMLGKKSRKAVLIGVGQVGSLVAERLALLGFTVTFCDPLRANTQSAFHSTALDEIADADLILLHVPLTQTGEHPTYHFIDKDFLRRQKPGCVLLNASRGAVIHTNDLLQYGKHLYWCLDVWEHEPRIDKALLERTLVATPHIAGYSVQSKIRGIEMIYQSACASKVIEAQVVAPITMPHQELVFTDTDYRWQDIVLGVFNPLVMTAMLRAQLLPAQTTGPLFDAMRNQFNHRHEFAFTEMVGASLTGEDARVIEGLGFVLKEARSPGS